MDLGKTIQLLGNSSFKSPFELSFPALIFTAMYFFFVVAKSDTLSKILVVTSGTMSK